MFVVWKKMLMKTRNKHAQLRSRRIRNRKSPWITKDLRRQIFNGDYLKKKAVTSNDPKISTLIMKFKKNKLIIRIILNRIKATGKKHGTL
jgi:hypothetical protein